MTEIKIPKKITPDPIIDSIVEIRFKSILPESAVFGTIYNLIKENYPNFKPMGIFDELKKKEPKLKYIPEGEIFNDDYSIGIGNNVILFKCNGKYKGWDNFSRIIEKELKKILNENNIIKEIERIGLRYINLFKNVLFLTEGINLLIDFTNKLSYSTTKTFYTTELSKNNFSFLVTIADKMKSIDDQIDSVLVDIDASIINKTVNIELSKLFDIINDLHKEEKVIFFTLLKKDFLEKYNPEY